MGIAGFALWNKMIKTNASITNKSEITIPFDSTKKIIFQDNYIIINKEGITKVYSSRCTHLGCKIDKSQDGNLICPCHGSKFNSEGMAIKGPATKSLEEKEFSFNENRSFISIYA